jgi:hypothetical protein
VLTRAHPKTKQSNPLLRGTFITVQLFLQLTAGRVDVGHAALYSASRFGQNTVLDLLVKSAIDPSAEGNKPLLISSVHSF